MIKKLKLKLVLLTMTSLFLLLAVLVTGMNVINYNSISKDADRVLEVISHNRGTFPEFKNDKDNKHKKHMSPEAPYESRFFTVLLDEDGNVVQSDTSRIKSVGTKEAIEYSKEVYSKNKTSGFLDIYRYIKTEETSGTRVIFLDCRKQLDSFYSFLYASIFMSSVGYLLVFAIIFFCSGKIISPISESYEKQKRFITDAGHEIKTPLTIINANTDILEAELGKNEGIDDIRAQTKRLTGLTNDLVYLARMEEPEKLDLIDIPLSEIVGETADSFKTLAQNQSINFVSEIEPLLSVVGNTKAVEQLINILLDNAIKYCPENGDVKIKLSKRGKYAEITVINTCESFIEKESLNKVFDRFYRSDLSRNSQTGGHGIGLSIAKAVVQKHSGKIWADTTIDGYNFKITVLLPM